MATYTWTGGAGNNLWSSPGNWSPSGPPPTNNSATLSIPGGSTITGIPNGSQFVDLVFTGTGTVSLSGGTISSDNSVAPPANLTLVLNNTSLTVSGTVGGAGTIELNGATVTSTGGSGGTGTFVFDSGSSNVLHIPNYSDNNSSLAFHNLGTNDQINIGVSGTVSLVANGTFNGVTKYILKIGGTTISSSVTFAPGATPTVMDSNGVLTFCFLAGTRLATPDGDIAVEDITAGTMVLTASGEAKKVRWLGRSTISKIFSDPLRSLPIRIAAGALGENLPARDLLVSPDHAVLIDDILVQAGALVNDISITRETNMPVTFVYYHVELASHDLVLAEGVPAESFVDNVDRMGFDNWKEHEAADGVAMTEMAYPRAKSARQVPQAIRARLLARAGALYGVEVAAAA